MPFYVQHIRNGEQLQYRWGNWHLQMFSATVRLEIAGFRAASLEQLGGLQKALDDTKDIKIPGDYIVESNWVWEDPSDGEVVTILTGDIISQWRGM